MLRIKKNRLIWIGITILVVILLGMPAVYAQDEPNAPEWVGSADEAVDSNAAVEGDLEVLGSTTQDFVYTPVTPCKIVDTRDGGGGFIYSGQTRGYFVHGNCASQGGTTCTAPRGEPRAVHISMAAVDPTGKGNIKAFPYGASGTAGLTVNFAPIGTNLNNAGTIQTAYNVGSDIGVKSSYAGTHVTIQVLGYYYDAEPEKITAVSNHQSGGLSVGTTYTTLVSKTVNVPYSGSIVLSGSASLTQYGINYMYCRFTENGSELDYWFFGDPDIKYEHTSRTHMKSVSAGTKTYAMQCYRVGGSQNSAANRTNLVIQFIKEGM